MSFDFCVNEVNVGQRSGKQILSQEYMLAGSTIISIHNTELHIGGQIIYCSLTMYPIHVKPHTACGHSRYCLYTGHQGERRLCVDQLEISCSGSQTRELITLLHLYIYSYYSSYFFQTYYTFLSKQGNQTFPSF